MTEFISFLSVSSERIVNEWNFRTTLEAKYYGVTVINFETIHNVYYKQSFRVYTTAATCVWSYSAFSNSISIYGILTDKLCEVLNKSMPL